MEQISEDLRVPRSVSSPHAPYLIAQGIGHKLEAGIVLLVIVRAVARWLSVGVLRRIEYLRFDQTEVFAPEHAAQSSSVPTSSIGLSIHLRIHSVAILHDNGQFRVVEADLRLSGVSS